METIKKLKDPSELLKTAKELSEFIKGEKFDSLILECRQGLGIYSTTISTNSSFSRWVKRRGKKTKKFDPSQVYSVKVYGLKPQPKIIREAVSLKDGEIILNLIPALEQEIFRLEIKYRMNEEWLESLVKSRSSPEPLESVQKWHLSAQLKDPISLQSGFSEVDVEEYPVVARVHIKEKINANIPHYVKQIAEVEAKILDDYNPRHATKVIGLQKEKARLKKKLGKEDLLTKLNELSQFISPNNFTNYVKIAGGDYFRLQNCSWGSDIFRALGLMVLPSKMEVVSRTDLNLERPATSGIMIYESKKFEKDVKKIFKN